MKPRFRKEINFGLGFKVPVEWLDKVIAGRDRSARTGAYSLKSVGGPHIELDSSVPVWDQLEAYSHEILHAAIDFDLYVRSDLIPELKREAEETKKHLEDD